MDLKELISWGNHLFARAPSRLRVYELVNGRRTAAEIAQDLGRSVASVQNDLAKMKHVGLIRAKHTSNGHIIAKGRGAILEKTPEARVISSTAFKTSRMSERASATGPALRGRAVKEKQKTRRSRRKGLDVPAATEIKGIAEQGESQIHEFKGSGVGTDKIVKEIAGMANTRDGGLVFYGIRSNGDLQGSDLTREQLDERVQNTIANNMQPSIVVEVERRRVTGRDILVVLVPPWARKRPHYFQHRLYIRAGTTTRPATASESDALHKGEYVA